MGNNKNKYTSYGRVLIESPRKVTIGRHAEDAGEI